VVQWSEFLATEPEVRVRFPALPYFRSRTQATEFFYYFAFYKLFTTQRVTIKLMQSMEQTTCSGNNIMSPSEGIPHLQIQNVHHLFHKSLEYRNQLSVKLLRNFLTISVIWNPFPLKIRHYLSHNLCLAPKGSNTLV
jgi:hypothetical protein